MFKDSLKILKDLKAYGNRLSEGSNSVRFSQCGVWHTMLFPQKMVGTVYMARIPLVGKHWILEAPLIHIPHAKNWVKNP